MKHDVSSETAGRGRLSFYDNVKDADYCTTMRVNDLAQGVR